MPRSYTLRTCAAAVGISGWRSIRAPPCAMMLTFTPVLPKVVVGMSPAFIFSVLANAPLIDRPVSALPTNVRLFMDSSPRCQSVFAHLLNLFGVSGSLHHDLRGGALDFFEIFLSKRHCNCPDVLLQSFQFSCAWDGNNPGLLGKQPRQRDLSRRRLLPLCNVAEQIDQCLIRFPSLGRKPRNAVTDILALERRALTNSSRKKALAQRAVRNEAYP